MASESEVLQIGKKLEKMVTNNETEHSSSLDILKSLKELPMTLEVLQKTRIGMTVNKFRKACIDDEVISLAKSLIKSWKKLLPGDASSKKEPREPDRSDDNSNNSSAPSTPSSAPKQTTFPLTSKDTSDSIRLKCRELLSTAMRGEGELPDNSGNPDDISAAVEDYIFMEFMDTGVKYKNRVRSRVANLKDKKNPALRENLLQGNISAERLAKMTAEEMANEEMRKLRDKLTKQAINDHQMAVSGGTETDLLKCGKCRQSKCTYNQVQTRSADEPMTTFVLCNNCGNRWKFC